LPAFWVAHLTLVLAVAAAAILWGRGVRSLPPEWTIGILVLIMLVSAAQFIRARRAGGAFGKGTGHALLAAGAFCLLVAKFMTAELLSIALTILSAIFFVSGTIKIVLQIRRLKGSQ
jgi:hypothetical protein